MDGGGRSIRIDAPKRWSDASGNAGAGHKLTPAQEVTKELEHNFGIDPTKPKPPAQPQPQPQQQQGAARTPPPSTLTTASPASKAPNEVLEPHTAPPGARPHIGAGETTMQNFCGASSPNWGPLVGGHFSPCFVQSFLFGAVDVAFVCLAVLRFRDLLALPPPPPRSLTRGQLTKVVCCSLVAVYNLVMFAVHLAFDYGQPYQWLMYPLSCMTWSLCTALLLCEARYGAPTNYVCRSFWISSFACATVMLWTNASDEAVSRRDFGAFMVHFALYGAMAALAVIHREDSQDYSALAIDFSEVSYEDEQTEATEETSTAAGGDGSVKAGGGGRGMSGGGGGGGGGASSGTLKRLVLLFAEEKWLVAASFACCLIGAPIEVVQFIYVGMIVDDSAVPDGPNTLPEYTSVLVALYLIEAVSSSSQLIVTMMVGEKIAVRLRRSVFQCALRQEVGYVEGPGGAASEIAKAIEGDVQRVQEAASVQVCMLLQSMIQVLVGGVFLIVLSWKLSLVSLALLPVIALMMLAQTTVVQSYSRRTVEALERVESYASEILGGVRTVRSFGKEGKERNRLGGELLHAYTVARSMGIANGVAEGLGVLVLKMCVVMGLFYGASLVHNDELSGGILVSYVFIGLQVIMSLSVLPPLVGDMSTSLLSASRIFAILDRKPKINSRGGLTLPSIEGRIELRDVTLSYQSSPDSRALARVNLSVEPGEHLSICGPSGSGKTSVLAVILRFFDPHEGLALLDDTDVTTFDPQWLRQLIGYVPQNPMLFTRTIEANIAFGQQASIEQVQEAATLVGLHDTVMSLPDRYRTVVGTHPSTLTRSFRLLVSAARAALKDPRILLLDEPLEGLPAAEVSGVAASLGALCSGRTVISVGHRSDVMEGADRVVVLRRGVVVETGTVQSLVASQGGRGLFATMRQGGRASGRGSVGGGGAAAAAAAGGGDFSDDLEEEEELSGGMGMGRGGGGGGGQGGGRGGGGGGNRAFELLRDIEQELDVCRPKQGQALAGARSEIEALKVALGRGGARGLHTI